MEDDFKDDFNSLGEIDYSTMPKQSPQVVNFPHTIALKDSTKILVTQENLQALMNHENVEISYDVLKKRPIVNGVRSLRGEEENTIIASLKSSCGLHGLNKSVVDDQLNAIMYANAKNPVTCWLMNIERTGTGNPVNTLIDSLQIASKEWAKIAFYRWLIQCAAAADAAENSGNKHALPKFESVLTFYGGQGLFKTAFMRSLLPRQLKSYMKDGVLLDLSKADSKTEALASWITELGELDSTFKKSDISALKAFLSRQEDEIRKPYARAASIMPRQTSFIGSVNEEKFLRDETGNRRYLPLTVMGELVIPDDFCIIDLWAYIWQEYKSGAQWWLTKDEEQLQKSALMIHEDNSFEEMLRDEFLFEEEPSYNPQALAGYDILDLIKVGRSRSNSTSLGKALKKMGIEKVGRLYSMPRIRKLVIQPDR
ncbi:MAG: hypothetical protein HOM11_06835 [Methylococcales bacterium]|nr:hypothetical protein [Methylococcales bacterium]